VKRVLASWLAGRGFLVPGSGAPHLRQAVAEPLRTEDVTALAADNAEALAGCVRIPPAPDGEGGS
jgi:hypothetical protein